MRAERTRLVELRRSRFWVSMAVFCMVLLAWSSADGAGAPKIDLRYYTAPVVIGRTTDWEYSDGSASSTTLIDADFALGGLVLVHGTSFSDGSITVSQTLEKKNKIYFAGLGAAVASGQGLILFPRNGKPARLQPLVQKFWKTYKSKLIRGDIFDFETDYLIGEFLRREQCVLAAYESISTPAGDFSAALRQDWLTDTYFGLYFEADFEVIAVGSYWYVAGEGIVAETQRTLVYQAGVLQSDSGFVDGWRVGVSGP